ncbi:MAG: histidine--tRNA ligase [Chthoniobacterales bacterium]
MRPLPGFRDFFPGDFAVSRYVFNAWRRVARRYGFVEYSAPTLENMELYESKNNGGEILGQLYQFEDKGGRRVGLRPEMTPTLARMVAAKHQAYKKPLKWFSIANFFRFERQQKGRLREFYQFNADLLGDATVAADAELLALSIDCLRELGFTSDDVVLRVSDREAWLSFLKERGIEEPEAVATVLDVVDKLEREDASRLEERLKSWPVSLAELREFIAGGSEKAIGPLLAEMEARGLREFVRPDLGIVRGLAYYTGIVFEIFDRGAAMRAVAGGGRYDTLIKNLSGGAADLPAAGFAMGDVVLGNLIAETPHAAAAMKAALEADAASEVYVVLADPERRSEALGLIQSLRDKGLRTDFSLNGGKVGKQFQAADAAGASFAVVVGSEWPEVKLKRLETREEVTVLNEALAEKIKTKQL